MTRREIIGRYNGSVLGIFWSFINPILMLAVYTFVFSVVFNARWSTETESKAAFALALFIGLIIHTVFAESVNRAPTLMLNNINYVKKVVFPLEILPWVTMGTTLFHMTMSALVWSLLYLIVNLTFQWTAIFVPIILLPLVLFTLGVSWFLASLGVYLRDIGQLTGVITTIMLFLSPVFFPISALPENIQVFIYANPLTIIIEQTRDALLWGIVPNFVTLLISFCVGLLVAWLGFTWFQATKKGFADVI